MPDWTLETWRALALILFLVCLLLLRIVWVSGSNRAKVEQRLSVLNEQTLRIQGQLYETREEVDHWQMNYGILKRALNEEAELEDGEEYVRKSLGLSSNEDHEESA